MNRLTSKIAIATCIVIIGLIAASFWHDKFAARVTPDLTVYSAKFCDLVNDSNRYDGKIVRVQAIESLGIDTPPILTNADCQGLSIRPICSASKEVCTRITQQIRSNKPARAKIDVIGRFTANVRDPDINSRGEIIHLLEILELKDIESVVGQ